MSKNTLKELGIKSIINYIRRSRQDLEKEKKTGVDTLHEQKKLMERVLAEYGIPYEQKLEIGSGDKISTRPIFQQVVTDLKNNKYDAIAVKEISRMGRGSYTDMGVIYDLITDKQIYIVTPWKIYNPSNPSDLRQIRFELFMSREEFETTRERLNSGRYNSALEGHWVSGPPPFGYDYDPKTKQLIINEKEAKIVRTIFDLYANGIFVDNKTRKLVQFRALATYLKRVGIKTITGKESWSPNYLLYFLTNDRYIGTYRFNEYHRNSEGKRVKNPKNEHIVIENNHPAIIDRETWDKVQHRINNRDTPTKTKLDFTPNRLAGLCVCKKCGKKFIRRASTQRYKKKDGTISVYEKHMLFCNTVGCTYVRYNAIEEDIVETLRYLGNLDQNTFKKTMDALVVEDKPKNSIEDFKKYIESKKEELENRMRFIYEKFEAGIYTDEMFLERKAEIDKEKDELRKVKFNEPNTEEENEYSVEETKTNLLSVVEAYESSNSDSEKNKLLHSVFDHIDIEVIKKGSGTRPAVHKMEPYLKSSFLTKAL